MTSDKTVVEEMARAMAMADGKDPDAPAWAQGYGNRAQTFGICWRDQYADMAQAAATIAQRRIKELEQQRLMILTAVYAEAPKFVATICDEKLDRSGALLGQVRELARAALSHRTGGERLP
jgi:hypothetical protein